MPFIALMHDEKTECCYAGYQRMEKSDRIEYQAIDAPITPIEYCGVSETLDGPIVRVERLLTPLSYAPHLGKVTPVLEIG